MSVKITPPAEDVIPQGYIVAAPRRGDMISGALCAAFGHQTLPAEDFSCLLREIDLADRNLPRC